jgi:hypothetical protein
VLTGGALAAIPISLWLGRAPLGELFSGNSFPTHFINALLSFADLLSGITTYTYIVGDPAGLFAHRVVSLGLLTGLALVLFFDIRGKSDPRIKLLSGGIVCSLISFLIIAGPTGLRPGSERYGLFVIAPILVLLSWTLSRPFSFVSTAGIWLAPFLGTLALISLGLNYFAPLRLSGGKLERTTRGEATEPLQSNQRCR